MGAVVYRIGGIFGFVEVKSGEKERRDELSRVGYEMEEGQLVRSLQ